MSLITRCPTCATMFKVVPDQLRVSEGWVRCGQCNEVFDANTCMQSGAQTAQTDHTLTPTATAANPSPTCDGGEDLTGDVHAQEIRPAPFLEVNPNALHIDLHNAAIEPKAPEVRHIETPQDIVENVAADAAPAEPHPLAVEQLSLHSFMRKPRTASRWHQTWVRVTLSLTAFLLGSTLAVQITVHERDRIVAVAPATKPVLAPMCELLNCTISPLRQIESVTIDSSAFTKVRGDVYRLSVTLKNTTHIPVATPSLELTLTDMQDQSLARRTFSAAEFSRLQPAIEPMGEMSAAFALTVKMGGMGEKVSGYRLLSFYP